MEETRLQDMEWLKTQLIQRHPSHTFIIIENKRIGVDGCPPLYLYWQEFQEKADLVEHTNSVARTMSRRMEILLFVENIFKLKHEYNPSDE